MVDIFKKIDGNTNEARSITGVVFAQYRHWINWAIFLSIITFIVTFFVLCSYDHSAKNQDYESLKNEEQALSSLDADKTKETVQTTEETLHDKSCALNLFNNIRENKIITNNAFDKSLKICTFAKEFDVDVYFLYAVLVRESRLKDNPEHALTEADRKKKPIGIGAVVWEWWGEELKEAGIAQKKDDLRDYTIGIRASAYVLSRYIKKSEDRLHPKASNILDSARAYYVGAYMPQDIEKVRSIYKRTKLSAKQGADADIT